LEVNWDRVRADRRALIHFFRTTEWCPFCVAQLIGLQEHAAEYEMRQIAVFAISPDPPARLAEFVAQNGITYAMLSDAGSQVIRRLGLLNTEVAESDPVYGIPYPGSLLIDRKGYIFEKRFHPDFHVREPMGSLLLYFELKDYSERLEEKVAERTRELEQAQLQMIETARVATLGKLVAAINHELNTPVGALASGLELMWNHYLPSGSQQQPGLPDLRRAIEAATARIVQVVAGLREFVRLDEAEPERADLRRSLDTVAELLGSEANSGITVRRDYEEIPPVYCRAAQVNHALWEVVTNSVESLGPQGTITLSATSLVKRA
jgi:peroxiredoxin